MAFIGNWQADTNTPYLIDGVGTQGDSYVVSVAGTQFLGTYTGNYIVGEYVTYQSGKWVQNRLQNHPPSNVVLASPVNTSGSLMVRPLRPEDLPAGGGGSGTVTSIATTLPITGGTITTSGTVGINKATSLVDGYLAASDWVLFNDKQDVITTGTTSQYIRGDLSLATFPSIPSVGTWGALNYPIWTSGTPFVKMTAAGTFGLDSTTYLSSVSGISAGGDLSGTYPNPTVSQLSGKSIATLSTGLFKYNGSSWVFDTSTYLTNNQSISLTSDVTGTGTTSITTTLKANLKIGSFGASFDGIGGVITNGSVTSIVMSYSGTITGWYLTSIQPSGSTGVLLSGSCTIGISKNGTDIINTGSGGIAPTLTSQSTNSGSTLTHWTTSFSAGDYFLIVINSVTTCINVNLVITTTKS